MMLHLHPPLKAARANSQEGHAVPMVGVHIGLHLENYARERILIRRNYTGRRLPRLRGGRDVDEKVEQHLDTKSIQRDAEKHRRLLPLEICVDVIRISGFLQQLDVEAEVVGE